MRDALGIALTGSDLPLHLILADARLTWDGPRDQAFYFVRDDGFCILLPLDDLHHRIVVGVRRPFDAAREPDFAELCAAARAAVGRPLSLGDPIWISSAPCYNRLAATNSHGRVFLAGDAAHLYSPIGGFGMNSAFGDAFNLGWKLAYVMRGHSPAALLDSYADERLRTARELLAVNDRFTSLIARLSRHTRADELAWLPTMANRPFLRQLRYSAAGLTLSYADVPQPLAGRTVVAGVLAPFADRLAGAGDGWPRHALVARRADLTRDDAGAQLQALAARFAPLVRVVVLDGPSALPPGTLALVRPDLVVEHVATGAGACSSLTEHLHRHYRVSERGAATNG